jgi:hypothetical protein
MTLRRQDMEPGTIVHVVQPRNGAYHEFVSVYTEPNRWGLFASCLEIHKDENLVIVRRPRKQRNEPNLIRVRRGDVEGEAMWCELRASCALGFKSSRGEPKSGEEGIEQ